MTSFLYNYGKSLLPDNTRVQLDGKSIELIQSPENALTITRLIWSLNRVSSPLSHHHHDSNVKTFTKTSATIKVITLLHLLPWPMI